MHSASDLLPGVQDDVLIGNGHAGRFEIGSIEADLYEPADRLRPQRGVIGWNSVGATAPLRLMREVE